jgi:hypothetical protein
MSTHHDRINMDDRLRVTYRMDDREDHEVHQEGTVLGLAMDETEEPILLLSVPGLEHLPDSVALKNIVKLERI